MRQASASDLRSDLSTSVLFLDFAKELTFVGLPDRAAPESADPSHHAAPEGPSLFNRAAPDC